ncbi:hypothetical protein BDA99DRAFT_533473 [Phascolomyces articulosus]|uniref:Uncharacterized protein n=1 Tax=Phascolomyces articulosus TaxID=60185 RepID=A0AAD5KIY9_9FUNG|nr:hypothetical protein BDA99DRAFT_533473 [Phascolomyces articulosus]
MNTSINANDLYFDPIDQLLLEIAMSDINSVYFPISMNIDMDIGDFVDLGNNEFGLTQLNFEETLGQFGDMTSVISDLLTTNLDQVQPADVQADKSPFRFTGEPRRPRQPVTLEEHKEIIRLYFEEKKSVREIERLSKIPSSTVGRHINDTKDGHRRE